MKNLALFYIKKRLPLFLIVLGITLIFSILFVTTTETTVTYYKDTTKYLLIDDGLTFNTSILIVLATIIPIYEFSFKMKKRGCDLFYSLPITRKKLYLFKYLFGFCEMLAIFIMNYLISEIVVICKSVNVEYYNQQFKMGYIFLYFGVAILLGILLYSWITFFYTRANTFFDGIISIALSMAVLAALSGGILLYCQDFRWIRYSNTENLFYPYHYVPFVSFINISKLFSNRTCELPKNYYMYPISDFYPDILTWILALGVLVLFIVLAGKEKAEESEDISDSPFVYLITLPVIIVSGYATCEISNPSWIALIIGGYIGYVIYNRNFLLRKIDLITLLASEGLGFALMLTKLMK